MFESAGGYPDERIATIKGICPNRGRRADKYLIGQADKGCFVFSPREVPIAPEEKIIKRIGLVARVKAPYAVFVKN